jgi:hypothetical protein
MSTVTRFPFRAREPEPEPEVKSGLEALGDITGMVISLILRAWVLMYLWGWFITVPPINAPMIGAAHAMGLSLTGQFFMVGFSASNNKKSFSRTLFETILGSLLGLGIGWVVHYIMVYPG